jgi:excisionase family DNA binding protein
MAKTIIRERPEAVPEPRPGFYTVDSLAAYADCDRKTVARAIERGDLRAYRPKGTRLLRIAAADADAWLLPASGRGGVR